MVRRCEQLSLTFQKTEDQDRVVWVEHVLFHLHVHALRHFGNVFDNRSAVLFRRVYQAVRAVVGCFLETMVCWMDYFKLLLFTTSTVLASVFITSIRARA